jgi:hypothetical protein
LSDGPVEVCFPSVDTAVCAVACEDGAGAFCLSGNALVAVDVAVCSDACEDGEGAFCLFGNALVTVFWTMTFLRDELCCVFCWYLTEEEAPWDEGA